MERLGRDGRGLELSRRVLSHAPKAQFCKDQERRGLALGTLKDHRVRVRFYRDNYFRSGEDEDGTVRQRSEQNLHWVKTADLLPYNTRALRPFSAQDFAYTAPDNNVNDPCGLWSAGGAPKWLRVEGAKGTERLQSFGCTIRTREGPKVRHEDQHRDPPEFPGFRPASDSRVRSNDVKSPGVYDGARDFLCSPPKAPWFSCLWKWPTRAKL